MNNSKILATSSYLPPNILKNSDLEKFVDTTDAWIKERTGIESRHIIGADESSASMAIAAAKKLFATSEYSPEDIDMILVSTCTPAKLMPANACFVQAELGCRQIPSFDINAACSGFLYALSLADQYIKTAVCKKILVIGSDAMTQVIDWEDRSTCVLFGDGAGAVLLGQSEEAGVISTNLGADGSYTSLLQSKGSLLAAAVAPVVEMQGKEVFKKAVKTLADMVKNILDQQNLSHTDISWLVPHQANKRIIEATSKALTLPMEKVILTIATHANTSSASVPLALDTAIKSGKIKRGDLLLLEAFGAGLTWGCSLVKY